jgi:hypothetical protein
MIWLPGSATRPISIVLLYSPAIYDVIHLEYYYKIAAVNIPNEQFKIKGLNLNGRNII